MPVRKDPKPAKKKKTPAKKTKKAKTPRKKRGPAKKNYFTKDHENAIIQYNTTESKTEKNSLYINMIGPVFEELINKIVYTYKLNNLSNIDFLKDECIIDLVQVLGRFDHTKGHKAFSYFTVVTRNWFYNKSKVIATKMRKEVPFDDVVGEIETGIEDSSGEYYSKREYEEKRALLFELVNEWVMDLETDNEKVVGKALLELVSNSEDIEIIHRRALYIYLREMTGFQNNKISPVIQKLKKKYREYVSDYANNKWDA